MSSPPPFKLREFAPSDLAACQTLYREGLLGPALADNDTGSDIDDIAAAYAPPDNRFWVAIVDGRIVGMIGVQHHDEGVGEIRRLRVNQNFRRRGIGKALIETAVKFCQDSHYLKITLDTYVERDAAISLFKKFRFTHSRSKQLAGKELMYFYLDLYTTDRPKP